MFISLSFQVRDINEEDFLISDEIIDGKKYVEAKDSIEGYLLVEIWEKYVEA